MLATSIFIPWSSPSIPLLTSTNSPIGVQLTKEEASWVVSVLALGMLPGSISVIFLIDKFGRKKTMMIGALLLFVPWILIIFANSFTMLLVARVVGGLGNGITFGVAPLYIGEISQKEYRGALCSMPIIGIAFGTIIVYAVGLKTIQQLSGMSVITAYLQTIMKESQTSLSEETSSVIFAAIQIPCVLMSSLLIDKLGRRPLLIISCTGCALSLAGEGLYFYLQTRNVDLSNAYFVPTLCLTMFYIMTSIGISNAAFIAAGELFAPNAKKIGGTVFAFYMGFLTFISNKFFNPIVESWGMHVAFWIFGGDCLLGILFGLFVLPETKACLLITWTSPTIPLLTSSNSPIGIQLSNEEVSWVVSALALGMMPGSIVVSLLIDRVGRKKPLLLSGFLIFLPWILIIFAKSFAMLLIARFIGGIACGISMGVAPLYIGEISQKEHRGGLCSMLSIGLVLGTILMYSIGPFVSYTTLAIFCASIPIVYIVAFSFMPDSPYYLIKNNQRQNAMVALTYLASTDDIEEWLEELNCRSLPIKKIHIINLNIVALKTIQEFSGIYVISAHIQTIMKSSQTSLPAQTSSLIFAAIQIPCVIISSFLVDKVGRKPLLIISASGCALTLLGEAVYFYLKEKEDVDLSNVYFIPTLCLTLYFVMTSFGISTMPHVAAGELFPTRAKRVGGTMFAFYTGLLAFISNKIFNPIVENWGMHVAFCIFAGVCVFGICFGLLILPETKGKSFEEIQELLRGKGKKVKSEYFSSQKLINKQKMRFDIQFIRSKQFISALIGTVLAFSSFLSVSWASPTIPLLTSNNSPIGVQLTGEEVSWVVSSLSLGTMLGSIILSFLIDTIGRKKTMLVAAFLLFVPWFLIIFANSLVMLLIARVVSGTGSGISIGVVSLYVGEIAEKKHRGTLCTMPTMGLVLATMFTYSVGPFVSYTTLAIVCGFAPFIFSVTSYFIAESPYYLIKINQRDSTKKTLKYLSGTDNVEEWMNEIEMTIQNDGTSKFKFKDLIFERNHRKSFLIVIALKTLNQFSGLLVINAYIQTIMEQSQTSLSAETSSLIFAAIQIPCVIVSSVLVDKFGRRPLLIISSLGCALSLAGEGVYFYLLQRKDADLSNSYFVPTLCLTLYFIMISFGISNIAFVALGELFTPKAKKIGGTVFAFYTGFLFFVSNKIFNPIVESWGMHVAFWIFAGVCLLGVFFGLFILPETKGKTFDEIQKILHGKEKSNKRSDNITVIN
ncbi:hypothetical protein FQR65_LT05482 [Abscondita terminalis]|nr:hypothetical protein FQR65_LT05482 [Abscondita terminalis]